ncbi:30S ribosomal protein S20 [bacterium]|jgi:ribosomal protein S20|nr:30S ribosomal protein S20 [bacterium]MBT4649076.1 30S ribosomal protein S20 [bacterium]
MPNKKSAIKYLRKSSKRNEQSSLVKRNIKEVIKRGKKAIADDTIKDSAKEISHDLQKAIDKAVKSGIMKSNTGDRKKSRFMDKMNNALKTTSEVKEQVADKK